MEIEHRYLTLKGRDHKNTFTFVYDSKDEICEKYNLDKSESFEFDCTTYMFHEYFDTTQFDRHLKLEDILGYED